MSLPGRQTAREGLPPISCCRPRAALARLFGGRNYMRPSSLERAFELARSGKCASMDEVRWRLRAEGYSTEQLIGPVLMQQLRELLQAAKVEPDARRS